MRISATRRTVFDLTLALRILDLLADVPVSSPAAPEPPREGRTSAASVPIIARIRQPTDFG